MARRQCAGGEGGGMFLYDKDKEDDEMTVIELYVVLKYQYKNTKITYPSDFTVGTQVSRGHWYIQESGGEHAARLPGVT